MSWIIGFIRLFWFFFKIFLEDYSWCLILALGAIFVCILGSKKKEDSNKDKSKYTFLNLV